MERVTLKASPRTVLGKKVRALRREGVTPIHVYGPGGDPLALQTPSDRLHATLVAAGRTTPVTIEVEGADGEQVTLVRGIARHAVTGAVHHVDFMRVDPDKPVEVSVPIVLSGEAPGTRGGGGFVTQGLYEVGVRAKPFEAPSEVTVDVSVLVDLDSVIRVGDLVFPGGAAPIADAATMVAWIQLPRVAEAEEVAIAAEEEAAEEEGEEAAAGEAGETPEGGEERSS